MRYRSIIGGNIHKRQDFFPILECYTSKRTVTLKASIIDSDVFILVSKHENPFLNLAVLSPFGWGLVALGVSRVLTLGTHAETSSAATAWDCLCGMFEKGWTGNEDWRKATRIIASHFNHQKKIRSRNAPDFLLAVSRYLIVEFSSVHSDNL